MIPPVETLLEEFETLSLDERAYVVLRSDEDLEVCIYFQRKDAPKCWSLWFKLSEEASKQHCTRHTLPLVLRAFQVSESAFSKEISTRLLTQAAFADEFVRSVSELLGADAVRESIRSTQVFMDNLRDMVRKTLGEASQDEDSSSRSGHTGHAPSKGHTGKGHSPASLGSLNSTSNPASPAPSKGHLRIIRREENAALRAKKGEKRGDSEPS